jgi:DNA-directed RNA polymerase II subunit RPB2
MEGLEARMHALAQQIYRDVGGSVKHIASYESFLNSLVALPRAMMPTRLDTEDVTVEGNVLQRHEIALVDVRVADRPIHIETDGTETSVTPQMARTRNLTYEIRLYGTFVYTVSSGIAHVFTSFALVDGEVAYSFRARRATDAGAVGDAADAADEDGAEGLTGLTGLDTLDAASVDGDGDTEALGAGEAIGPVGDQMYIRGADDVERCVAAETASCALFDATVAAAFERAVETRTRVELGERLEETLVGAVTQAVRVHGATAVDREVVRAAILARTHECTSVRTVAAVLRDVAMRTAVACSENAKMSEERHTMPIGAVPLMVWSSRCVLNSACSVGDLARAQECPMDRGGYFIVNGTERIIPLSERREPNLVAVHTKKTGKKVHVIAEVQSRAGSRLYTLYMRSAKPDARARAVEVAVQMPFARPVPVVVMMRALGVTTDKDIYEMIVPTALRGGDLDPHVAAMLREAGSPTQREALALVAERLPVRESSNGGSAPTGTSSSVRRALESDLLPHIGHGADAASTKAFVLAHATQRVLEVALGLTPQDDRDNYARKRVDGCGALLGRVAVQQISRTMMSEMRQMVRKQVEARRTPAQIQRTITYRRLGDVLRSTIASGRMPDGSGVSEVLCRTNVKATDSMLSRCNASCGAESMKQIAPRKLHGAQYGVMCPCETPEGQSIGLVKNLSCLAFLTGEPGSTTARWTQILLELGMRPRLECATRALIDGVWVGSTDEPRALAARLRDRRRQGLCSAFTGVAVEGAALMVSTDAGRIVRPLLVVENNALVYDGRDATVAELVALGMVDMLDCREASCAMVAATREELAAGRERYTHCEIHPVYMFGVTVAGMPFPDHNQSPRNVYYAAMGKQAVGVSTLSNGRMDTLEYRLHYPQVPLASSTGERVTGRDDVAGLNPVVAIMTMNGYNQEDSVVLNRSSVERGFGHSTVYRTYRVDEKSAPGMTGERICNPGSDPSVSRKKIQAYDMLDSDGIVEPGVRVVPQRDVLVGKVVPMSDDDRCTHRDDSLLAREEGIVNSVVLTTNSEGRRLAKVQMRSARRPTIGDKIASRHGQKGVCGMMYGQEDMPWNAHGISPDVVMNPHAIPSRMTIGHMKEALLAKLAAVRGMRGDATPFSNLSVDQIASDLHACGYQRYGDEVLYSGTTGRRIGTRIFMGPGPYYQILKHQVKDKIHSRARGPMQAVTRQPSAGRSKDGALRLGEMERDCLISHGTACLMLERMLYSSDVSEMAVCKLCGLLATLNAPRGLSACSACKQRECVELVRIPHPMKALIQELYATGIALRLELE